jgi:Zn-dependent peptidase ImmA (M78 family)
LRNLDLPIPFEVHAFCRRLAARRAREIVLEPVANAAGPHGLWLAGDNADFVFYQQHTSPAHQDHIILHELCHLLCDHRAELWQELPRQRLMPDLQPETVQRVLSRASYSDDQEREAELLASLILERSRGLQVAPVEPPGSSEALVQRLAATLGDEDA